MLALGRQLCLVVCCLERREGECLDIETFGECRRNRIRTIGQARVIEKEAHCAVDNLRILQRVVGGDSDNVRCAMQARAFIIAR
ncbi:hypothetical protein D3C87_800050 [compost metagenome]